MRLKLVSTLAGFATLSALSVAHCEERRAAAPVKQAVERSLSLMQKSLAEYPKHVSCFSCHHQGVPMFALSLARSRGYVVDEKNIEAVVKHTSTDLKSEIELYRTGKGQPGGVTRAGYALLCLQSSGVKNNEVTAAVAGFLLQSGKEKGFWNSSSNRPPSEMSSFTNTFVAIRALKSYSESGQQDAVKGRLERARQWLEQAQPKDTEDRVFRLWGMAESGSDVKEIKKAAQELLAGQRADGGWAQLPGVDSKLPGGASDAYATGSVLTALCLSGVVKPKDAAFQRGVTFLLSAQQPDGSWHVVSRSKPFQPYFESGFPYGKDQFISMAASAWATAALILDGGPAKVPE